MSFFTSLFKDSRSKGITDLCAAVPGCTRSTSNKNNVVVNLKCPNSQFSSLSITILDTFPSSAPVVSVMGPLQHPWIDQYRYVCHVSLWLQTEN